jgi:ribosome biogenesis GTPase / thiamine phosphate phosphatase
MSENLVEGRVLSIASQEINVQYKEMVYSCTLRGVLKKEKTTKKNLIIVGDLVLFDRDQLVISKIQPRHSLLSRQENYSRKKEQLIAANIDSVFITSAAARPTFKPHLIDRYIIAAMKGNIEPIILFNKIDVSEDLEHLKKAILLYKKLGFKVLTTSCKTYEGIDQLKDTMKNKASLFAGQSGVGKSSLINIITGLSLKTLEVSEKNFKGRHTTTSACLIPLDFGGWCIDTPGIRTFGVWDLTIQDLQSYFPEIDELRSGCHFPNCSHTHEPKCAVLDALVREEISEIRYQSYTKLLEETKTSS